MFTSTTISGPDLRFLRSLRERNVLQEIQPQRLNFKVGSTAIFCPDCDRYNEKYHHLLELQSQQRPTPRVHPFAWNGGALRCAPNSPLNAWPHEHEIFLNEIKLPRDRKGLYTLNPFGHWPCGKALEFNLTAEAAVLLLTQAHRAFKAFDPEMQVATLFHVDYGEDVMRTYCLCMQAWDAMISREQASVLA